MIIKSQGNKLFLLGTIYDGDGVYFEMHYSEMEALHTEVDIHIHTNGGNVFDGNYIQNRIKTGSITANTINMGSAFSMGGYIMLAGVKRKAARNSFIMIHAASGGSGGTSEEKRDEADVLDAINKNFSTDLKAITGQSDKTIKKWLSKDTYFSSEKALEVGLITEVIEPFTEITEGVTAEKSYPQFVALFEPPKTPDSNLNTDNTMKQPLITALGLTSVTAESSDTAVMGAVNAHIKAETQAWKTKYENEVTAHNALKEANQTRDNADIEALLAPLAATHKKEVIESFRTIGKTSGVTALRNVINNVAPRQSVTDFIPEGSGGDGSVTAKEGWNWDKYQKEDQAGLEAMQKSNLTAFKALYKAKYNKEFEA